MTRNKRKTEPPIGESIQFSVKEVVADEIDAAIMMLIIHGNLVASHLLAQASLEIVRRYAAVHGIVLTTDIHTMVRDVIPDLADKTIKALTSSYNGLKHYKAEVEGNVTIGPSLMQAELWLGIGNYMTVFGPPTPVMVIYYNWYIASKCRGVVVESPALRLFPSAALDLPMGRRFREARQMLMAMEERNQNPA